MTYDTFNRLTGDGLGPQLSATAASLTTEGRPTPTPKSERLGFIPSKSEGGVGSGIHSP